MISGIFFFVKNSKQAILGGYEVDEKCKIKLGSPAAIKH